MCQAFRTYVEQLDGADTELELRNALAGIVGNFDLPHFAYIDLLHRKSQRPQLITNYPLPWAAHYLAHDYQNADPVLSHSRVVISAFGWNPGFASDKTFDQRFFCEAADFGICFGHTIPIHNRRGPVAAVTFATDGSCLTFSANIRRNADTLELIALYFHANVVRKLGILQNVYLTERERQCLYWASLGKSAPAIGEILKLSERIVKFHLHNVRAKFDVATTIQAVVAYERAKLRDITSL